ncbi:unnamed protein product [Arctia plantaginis]|uniref:Uncharacterized protein n=1 Tax=Arctia plantaginis TaxID=874455 RepID=A0A8S1BL33_ARCPL|nr:unnamed protein product [Arctia plantaginis]
MLSIRYEEAKAAAFETFNAFQHMFITCAMSTMPEQHFKSGELKNFVNYPPKTTIGLAPKFTSNRKYFANLISSIGFKTMLANDEEEIRRDKVRKLKYCDKVIMDVNVLKEFYDREIDLTKM